VSATIYYTRESCYGRVVRRIAEHNAAAQAFQDLSGHATLTEADCRHLGALGVTLVDVTAKLAAQSTEVR
jgi:hypothetical protein